MTIAEMIKTLQKRSSFFFRALAVREPSICRSFSRREWYLMKFKPLVTRRKTFLLEFLEFLLYGPKSQ